MWPQRVRIQGQDSLARTRLDMEVVVSLPTLAIGGLEMTCYKAPCWWSLAKVHRDSMPSLGLPFEAGLAQPQHTDIIGLRAL